MSNFRKKLDILENANDALLEELELQTILTQNEMDRMFKASERHSANTPVSHIIPVRSPNMKNKKFSVIAAAAACLIAIASITFGIRSTVTIHTETNDIASAVSVDENVRKLQTLDMDSKENIYHKVLNSIDYYNYAEGTLLTNMISSDGVEFTSEYALDLSEGRAYEHIHNEETEFDARIFVKDGLTYSISLPTEGSPVVVDVSGSTGSEENYTVSVADGDNSGVPEYSYRLDPTNLSFASSYSLFPQEIIFSTLSNLDNWEPIGKEEYLGRQCIAVEGGSEWTARRGSDSFKMLIDEKSGILLALDCFDTNGNSIYYIKTVKFSDNRPEIPELEKIPNIFTPSSSTNVLYQNELLSSIAGTYTSSIYGMNSTITISEDGTFSADGISGQLNLFSIDRADGSEMLICSLILDESKKPYLSFAVDDPENFDVNAAMREYGFERVTSE